MESESIDDLREQLQKILTDWFEDVESGMSEQYDNYDFRMSFVANLIELEKLNEMKEIRKAIVHLADVTEGI